MTTAACPQLGVEDWMEARKQLLRQYLGTEKGRSLILTSMLGPLRDVFSYVTRPKAERFELSRLASLVVQADALMSVCTGGEKYDRVAFIGVLADAKAVVEGVKPEPREAELAEWVRTTTKEPVGTPDVFSV